MTCIEQGLIRSGNAAGGMLRNASAGRFRD
jgi:hypothetical protein